ncbi:MAG: cupin domain-containing protein [Candidatus Cloacimonetes bacterium]|jgi:mannose-6-phosphate isomerase-like protein (cupin superfamily)|nr:cupin domain-containing protein [Candidatus Cloacimonadota bacterium]
MNNLKKEFPGLPYPEMIKNLPEIEIPIDGIRGWLLQSKDKQVVFFDIEPVGKMPDHSHCGQWGIMIDGEMELTIDGNSKIYRKGDSYFIPAGIVHSANFLTKVNVMDVFDDPERYKTK